MKGCRAWAPGHVTGFFAGRTDHDDPLKKGSVGAGFSVSAGAEVCVSPGKDVHILNGHITRLGVVDRILGMLPLRTDLTVVIKTDLPLGQGFGMSAAIACATALAISMIMDTGYDPYHMAHLAEVMEGTGLGDVAGIYRGGFEVRVREGIPPFGEVKPLKMGLKEIYLKVLGEPLSTIKILTSEKRKTIDRFGEDALHLFLKKPTIESFWRTSRWFAVKTGLLTDKMLEELRGKRGSMCMLGNSVFSFDPLKGGTRVFLSYGARIMDMEGCHQ